MPAAGIGFGESAMFVPLRPIAMDSVEYNEAEGNMNFVIGLVKDRENQDYLGKKFCF